MLAPYPQRPSSRGPAIGGGEPFELLRVNRYKRAAG